MSDQTEKRPSLDGGATALASSSPAEGDTEVQQPTEPEHEYPGPAKRSLIMVALYICMFLGALDKNIIATAIPSITNSFSSLKDIGWYASAYMLTLCAFQLLWGRVYTFYDPKPVYLASIVVFEIGSLLCGVAPNSAVFILGRAIAGVGSAGISNGTVIIMISTVPLDKRPAYQGMMGMIFAIASIVGPLLGGVFTERVTWRWCFYINLPFGALTVAAVMLLVQSAPTNKEEEKKKKLSLLQQFQQLDPVGSALFIASVVSLLLALQWGGTTYAWSNWRIILLLVLFPVLLISFIVLQVFTPETSTLPIRIITNRIVAGSLVYTTCSQAAALVITYFIPLYFQALRGYSPLSSGLATLPTILSLAIAAIISGRSVQKFGIPAPFLYASAVISSIGAGLISSWSISASHGRWIGFQVLFGFGVGLAMQMPSILAQMVLPKPDIPTGISLIFFMQNFGGAIFVSVAQNIFTDNLAGKLSRIPGLGLRRKDVVEMGATEIRRMVPKELLGTVLKAYGEAVRYAFYVGVGLACFAVLGALVTPWISLFDSPNFEGKGKKKAGKGKKDEGEEKVEEV